MPYNTITIITGVLYLFVFVICLINIIKPKYLWKLFASWKAKTQPSEAYFKMIRIRSLVALIIITLVIAGPTIMYLLDK